MAPKPQQQNGGGTTTTPSGTTTTTTPPSSVVTGTPAGSTAVTTGLSYEWLLEQLAANQPMQPVRLDPVAPRWASDPNYMPENWTPNSRYATYMTTEGGLVDSNGNFLTDENGERYLYDPGVDGFNAWVNADPDERERIADIVRSKGYNVETTDDYIQAFSMLFDVSNNLGVTFDRAIPEFKRLWPDIPADVPKAPTYRVTSTADIKAVAKNVAYQTLGRAFTEQEADQFAQSYQQMQVQSQAAASGGGVVESAPDIGVAAEQFAQTAAPKEADAYQYLGHVNALFGSLGAL